MSKFLKIYENCKQVSEKILEAREKDLFFRVISHLDADGIAAAGITSHFLLRMGANFHLRIVQQLREENLREIQESKESIFVFTDLGSGQIGIIEKNLPPESVIIMDHHPPEKETTIHQANPHLWDINGATEISGAGITYLVAKSIDNSNMDLAPLAVVGALGDRQDKGEQHRLNGINAEIVKDGINKGVLEETTGIRLFGRETRPIATALEYTTDPFIPGLSGNHGACLKFLTDTVKIPLKTNNSWRTISDLSQEEKTKLVSELIQYMLGPGEMTSEEAQSIVGVIYILPKEEKQTPLRDAREYSALLNACGRMKKPGLGVAICLGDRKKTLEEVENVATDYREKLSGYMGWLIKPGTITQMEHLQSFHGGKVIDDRIIGTIASIAISSGIIPQDKPVLAFAESGEDMVKVSARATDYQVQRGIDLGAALRSAVKEISSEATAGGHNIAAGAHIPIGTETKLLQILNKIIKNQLGENGASNESKY
ncbi:MAG: DHH family phosphoesterase [Candidatus Jordarchaeum sp.]|uniref:DHH family phosphoesterase n=1 Tax=Candidatus Jordarchaeum sp. TaxID=2823881 RepID=UPI00404A2633